MGRLKTTGADLPPRMLRRIARSGNTFYYYCTKPPNRKEIPLGANLKTALSRHAELYAIEGGGSKSPIPHGHELKLLKHVQKNAKARGIDFSLSYDDILDIFSRSKGCCELTGIPFDMNKGEFSMRPWIPSVDRIDSSEGYTKENCRLVCASVNIALNQFGEHVLRYISGRLKRYA